MTQNLPAPEAPPEVISSQTTVYTLFHSGSGSIETDKNPSNDGGDNYPPIQKTFPSTITQNQAILNCATFSVFAKNSYYAFQLYFLASQDQWICRSYYHSSIGGDSDSSSEYFNVHLAGASPVFGYQNQG